MSVRIHLQTFDSLDKEHLKGIENVLILQRNRIYSPVHSLAFIYDPLYKRLRQYLIQSFGSPFTEMDSDYISDSHNALEMLQDNEEYGEVLMYEYMGFSVKPDNLFSNYLLGIQA